MCNTWNSYCYGKKARAKQRIGFIPLAINIRAAFTKLNSLREPNEVKSDESVQIKTQLRCGKLTLRRITYWMIYRMKYLMNSISHFLFWLCWTVKKTLQKSMDYIFFWNSCYLHTGTIDFGLRIYPFGTLLEKSVHQVDAKDNLPYYLPAIN